MTAGIEILLGQACHVGSFDHIQPCGCVALRIEHAERLENSDLVSLPLFILGEGKPHREKTPGCPNFMIAVLHMTGLTGWRGHGLWQHSGLFQEMSHTMLGG